jgi:ABC-2 type transport system ATP-binding protein
MLRGGLARNSYRRPDAMRQPGRRPSGIDAEHGPLLHGGSGILEFQSRNPQSAGKADRHGGVHLRPATESATTRDGRSAAATTQPGDAVPAVQLIRVEKAYGLVHPRPALRGVSLRIARGECYGLAGRNGAGKTTLIKVMLGLIAPDSGEARLFGVSPDVPDIRRRVGFVPEAAELPPGASPLQLVRRWAQLRGLPMRPAVDQGEANLRRLGMAELLRRPAHRFSKGEKQRTLFALALIGEPDLLVLDEPTDGLDPLGRALVRKVILEECATGRTVFINSHLLSETERVCTRVGILHEGQIVREEALGRQVGEERATSALVVESELDPSLQATLGARRPAPDGGAAHVYLVEHEGLEALNRAIDRVRAAGVRVVEVRRVRRDLEETFTEVATAGPGRKLAAVDAGELVEGRPPPSAPLRGVLATLRVAQEIGSDLIARKMAHLAAAGATLMVAVMFFALRNQIIQAMAATARQFRAGGLLDDAQMTQVIGRGAAVGEYWSLLFGGILLSALFAPQLIDARRSTLVLAQPVSRADFARGIFVSVCALALAVCTLSGAALFAGARILGLRVSATLLIVPLMTTVAFASIYAGVLLATYLFPNGLFAAMVGTATALALVIAGNTDAAQPANGQQLSGFVFGLLPKIVGLHHEAMRLGAGSGVSAFPIASTLAYSVGLLLVVQVVARRSER